MAKLNEKDNESIKTDFVRGHKDESGALVFPDCVQLGEKYGLSANAVRSKCNKERWRDLRTVLQIETAAEADAIFRQKMAGKLAEVDTFAFSLAFKGLKKVQKGLDETEASDAKSINSLAVAARLFLDISHRASGKVKKDFASIIKLERRTSVKDEQAEVEHIVSVIMENVTDVHQQNRIIAALDPQGEEEGG